jgi:hypothetical protein
VRKTVDHTSCPERNPHHLHGPDGQTDNAEQRDVQHHHQAHAEDRVLGVDVAFHPVVRRAVTELAHRFFILGFGTVQFRAFEQHLPDAARLRTVRIFFGLALGVVLTMDRGPLAGQHASGHPQPEAEKMTDDRMQLQRAVRLAAMQIDRHADNRDVRRNQRVQHELPPREVQQTVGKEVEQGIQQGNLPVERETRDTRNMRMSRK